MNTEKLKKHLTKTHSTEVWLAETLCKEIAPGVEIKGTRTIENYDDTEGVVECSVDPKALLEGIEKHESGGKAAIQTTRNTVQPSNGQQGKEGA